MLTSDLRSIVELMSLAGGKYPCVKVESFRAYATNGKVIIQRPVEFTKEGFIDKHFLPQLKGILETNKKNEFIEETLEHFFVSDFAGFPATNLNEMLDKKFEHEIYIDADNLKKAVNALKSKDNRVILKFNGNGQPILFEHEKGKGMLAPCKID